MTLIEDAIDTQQANAYASGGLAMTGDLVVWKSSGELYKVTGNTGMKYKAMNKDGRDYRLPYSGCEAAPVGAIFAGPEKSRNQLSKEKVEAAASELKVGDVVEMFNTKNPWPGQYLITKRTNSTRFKVQQIGGYREGTAPATMLRKVTRTSE